MTTVWMLDLAGLTLAEQDCLCRGARSSRALRIHSEDSGEWENEGEVCLYLFVCLARGNRATRR